MMKRIDWALVILAALALILGVAIAGSAVAQERPPGLHPAYILSETPALAPGTPVPSSHPGRWDRPTLDDLVVEGDPGQTYAQGVVRRLRDVRRGVFVCTAPAVPLGQRDGCPTPGVYTGERYGTLQEVWSRAARPMTCIPDFSFPVKVWDAELPVALQSAHGNRVATWTCQTPTGYVNETWRYSASKVAGEVSRALRGLLDESAAQTRCAAECTADTDPVRRAAVSDFVAPHRASVKVAVSGTATSRPVYSLNADGTRSTVAIPGARVAVGGYCWMNRRVPGTNYYDVSGSPNVATTAPDDQLPARTVALCTLYAPYGVNQ